MRTKTKNLNTRHEDEKLSLVQYLVKLKKEVDFLKDRITKLEGIPSCPKCKGNNIIKHGGRKTGRGWIQRYLCKSCKESFVGDSKKRFDYRMRTPDFEIRKAMRLRKKGYTYSQIAEVIGGVTRQTVMRWLRKYQPIKKEKISKVRKMKSRWGTEYSRKFKIKV